MDKGEDVMAKLSDILNEMNNECTVQFLNSSVVNVVDKKRTKDTELTFATSEITCNSFDGDKVGIVVWLSRDKYNDAVKNLNSKRQVIL